MTDTCPHGILLSACNMCQLGLVLVARDTDYGWSGLSRTGKLIWLHAARKEGFNVRSRAHNDAVVLGESE